QRKVKPDGNLQGLREAVTKIRRTQQGELLIELGNAVEKLTMFNNLITEMLGEAAEIRSLSHRVEIECKDLDEVTTKEDIIAALANKAEVRELVIEDIHLRKPYGGTQTASIKLPIEAAKKSLSMGWLKVGWVRCRLRERAGGAAIWSCGCPPSQMTDRHAELGFSRAKIAGIYWYSCYLAPSLPLDEYTRILDRLIIDVRGRHPVVIAGDFNAWALEWGSRSTNARGNALLDAFASLEILLLNSGRENTFSKAGYGSIVDLTFASPQLARVAQWHVSEIYT
ncbi:hypothetical protein KR044_005596, partial [Drosophila immigrans]